MPAADPELAAEAAQANFIERFQKGALPDSMPELTLDSEDGALGIASLLKGASLTASTSEAFRMVECRHVVEAHGVKKAANP